MHGGVADIARSGPPRETTLRPDRHIHLTRLRNCCAVRNDTARNTAGRNRPRISTRAVGLRCRRPYIGAVLTSNHRRLDSSTGSIGVTPSKMALKSNS